MPNQTSAEDKNPILEEFSRFKEKKIDEEPFKEIVEIHLLGDTSVIKEALDDDNFYTWAFAQRQKIEKLDKLLTDKELKDRAHIIEKIDATSSAMAVAAMTPVTKARVKTFLEEHKIQFTGDKLNLKHQIKNDFLTQINAIRKTTGKAFDLDEMVKMGCDNLKENYPDITPKVYKKELLSEFWNHPMRSLIDIIDKDWKNKEAPEQKEPTRKRPS